MLPIAIPLAVGAVAFQHYSSYHRNGVAPANLPRFEPPPPAPLPLPANIVPVQPPGPPLGSGPTDDEGNASNHCHRSALRPRAVRTRREMRPQPSLPAAILLRGRQGVAMRRKRSPPRRRRTGTHFLRLRRRSLEASRQEQLPARLLRRSSASRCRLRLECRHPGNRPPPLLRRRSRRPRSQPESRPLERQSLRRPPRPYPFPRRQPRQARRTRQR